jgi:hypothetical protein
MNELLAMSNLLHGLTLVYLISALLAAITLLPYVAVFHNFVRKVPSPTPNAVQLAVSVLMLLVILAPMLNTLVVLTAIDCYFRYSDAQ